MTCIAVYHQAVPTADGRVAVIRITNMLKGAETTTTSEFCVILTPGEARQMAEAMRATNGHFLKEDGADAVDVWCEPYEAFQITWTRKGGAEVCEAIYCCESGGDGWSWEFAQALEDAASKAEAGE